MMPGADDRQRYYYNSIISSMNKYLGDGSADLVIKTLRHVYKTDVDEIKRKPEILEGNLDKILGKGVAELILKEAKTIAYGSKKGYTQGNNSHRRKKDLVFIFKKVCAQENCQLLL